MRERDRQKERDRESWPSGALSIIMQLKTSPKNSLTGRPAKVVFKINFTDC